MISISKLELVKILLNNKRDKLYKVLGAFKNINQFIYESGDSDILLKNVLTKSKINEVRDCFFQLFEIIEAGIHPDLRLQFHQFTKEFEHETIDWSDDMLYQITIELQYSEIQKIEDAIAKTEKNIQKLKNK